MSDGPASSTARPQPISTEDGDTQSGGAVRERRQRNRRLFNKKREAFLADLMRNVDILVYAELSTVYYMDCSFLRFALRAFIQFVLLTPKPSIFPDPPPQNRPIGLIIGTNLLCLILHLYLSRPEASEATRGYLHGGLAMDFIGQKGPSSKLHLAALDLLVLGLQVTCLGIQSVKKKAKEAAAGTENATGTGNSSTSAGAANQTSVTPAAAAATTTQTLDFEERGLHMSDHQSVDIELQDLNADGARIDATSVEQRESGDERDQERESLLATHTAPRSDSHLFDAFNSGEVMIADLSLQRVVREQFLSNAEQAGLAQEGGRSSASTNAITASFANSGLNFRLRIGNRILGV